MSMDSGEHYFIGIDLGTSGIRACAINAQAQTRALAQTTLPPPSIKGKKIEQDPGIWWMGVISVLKDLLQQINPHQVEAICIDGTSGTLLVTDDNGIPLSPALMYNDSRCTQEAEQIKSIAPNDSAAHGTSSGLAKLLYLQKSYPEAIHALHQSDWITGKLSGFFDISDENNALKTGYDAMNRKWPEWMNLLGVHRTLLPKVVPPGAIIGQIHPSMASYFNLPNTALIVAGTTDSIAAFIATGAKEPGEAVTSLGSTLVLKIISDKPIYAPKFGIYSHRYGNYWLAGGASNSGGAVLRKFFTDAQMADMTPKLNPNQTTQLDYYPLLNEGERFPINDPNIKPRLEPRPKEDVVFFQGILESIARIEYAGYKKLQNLGAPWPVIIRTAGGGSSNHPWIQIRQELLKIPVIKSANIEACYGAAMLAFSGIHKTRAKNE